MHPENALFALLLPGAVFCILMFMERKKHTPRIIVYGWKLPIWMIYAVVFITGPLMLILMLANTITKRHS